MLATEKQVNYIKSLLSQRRVTDAFRNATIARLGAMPSGEASMTIARLLASPLNPAPELFRSHDEAWPTILEGRYAIEIDGTTKFYKIDKPTEGKWRGCIFVKVFASDELYPIKSQDARNAILGTIALDPAGAARRYGLLIGSCSICGRTLTDDTSRKHGIGPICRESTGW
jgi:hypothetical protein